MSEKAQLNVRIPGKLHDRLSGILEKLRNVFGVQLSLNDVASMGIDLLDQWLDLYGETRKEMLGQVEPRPQEPLDAPRPGRGRPRKSKDGDEGDAE